VLRRFSDFLTRSVRVKRREEAACYRYDGSLFLCAINEVRNGPGVEWEPSLLLPVTASDDVVGAALSQVLDGSGQVLDLNSPDELRAARREQLRAAGLSSERRLQQSAIRCWIERLPDRVRFIPTHNGGTRGDTKGFQHLEGAATAVNLPASEAELGEALRAALSNCTSSFDPPAA
jgi:hypothetical protein